jgi:hypothetical protein
MEGGPGVSAYLPSWKDVAEVVFSPTNEDADMVDEAYRVYLEDFGDEEAATAQLHMVYEDSYKDFRKIARGFTVPLRIYRSVTLSDPDALRIDPIGEYWTWDGRTAEPYAADLYGYDLYEPYLLVGEVAPEDVNWLDTAVRNTVRASEKEITVKPGHRVRLLAVLDPDGNVVSTEVREARANPRRRC